MNHSSRWMWDIAGAQKHLSQINLPGLIKKRLGPLEVIWLWKCMPDSVRGNKILISLLKYCHNLKKIIIESELLKSLIEEGKP